MFVKTCNKISQKDITKLTKLLFQQLKPFTVHFPKHFREVNRKKNLPASKNLQM